MTVDFERLVDRAAIWREAAGVAEEQWNRALREAAFLARPRLTLLDPDRRIVRLVNAPEQARRDPPRLLRHAWSHPMESGPRVESVGKLHDRPNPRDLDYRLARTRGADDLLGLLADEIEPTVLIRRYSGGRSAFETTFEE